MSNQEITIRSVQHYIYCPHRWGLLEIDRAWAENYFVTKADLLHRRVHDPENYYSVRGKKVYTSVPIYNDLEQYNLYGIADCLEVTEDPNGVSISGSTEKYKICIVEYKPTKPGNQLYREEDLLQVFAQKICVDYVFGGDCSGVLYYADVRKRISLPLKENYFTYDERLKGLLKEMRTYMLAGKIPAIRAKQQCSGCSMKDLCMPSVKSARNIQKKYVKL